MRLTTIEDCMAWLEAHGIDAELHRHPPVFTVEEARAHTHHLPGGHVKNLFLEDRKGGLWLVTCLDEQTVKVNALARLLGAPRCSFAGPERLMEVLGVEPGSVTPLALINDRDRRVIPVWDSKMLGHARLNCHPLRNTATCTIGRRNLERVAELTGHRPVRLDLDASLAA
jgi:Ala-tRNA(Pro) deacylase